jgi:hypothetical protein
MKLIHRIKDGYATPQGISWGYKSYYFDPLDLGNDQVLTHKFVIFFRLSSKQMRVDFEWMEKDK